MASSHLEARLVRDCTKHVLKNDSGQLIQKVPMVADLPYLILSLVKGVIRGKIPYPTGFFSVVTHTNLHCYVPAKVEHYPMLP